RSFGEDDELSDARCVKEGLILTRSGKRIAVEMQVRKITWQDRRAQVIALQDITFRKTLEHKTFALESENLKLKLEAALGERDCLGALIGRSPVMRDVCRRLFNIAASDETVIIYGESGTGKELAAQTVFNLSWRFNKKFIPVNCGAIPETLFESEFFGYCKGAFTGALCDTPGHFEEAQGGVLFLDEVSELSLPCQIKLLRVLNNKTYTPLGASTPLTADVRIIAATAQNLKELTGAGKIRPDFFYRIHVIALEMPPLREHKEDIPLLAKHFITQHTPPDKNPPAIPSVIYDIFQNYHWPGNVRELFNELRRYLFSGKIELSETIAPHKAPQQKNKIALKPGSSFNASIAAYEKQLIRQALKETGGNKKAAA
ncbi:MAG: sigma-54-dependent Fis family transcriptional regulator, partial [Gammaproteobacteria bacterium]|nr:sigma-54-dependent Fis family transcriptional regulator [Gammaproteobacteria bacterium]